MEAYSAWIIVWQGLAETYPEQFITQFEKMPQPHTNVAQGTYSYNLSGQSYLLYTCGQPVYAGHPTSFQGSNILEYDFIQNAVCDDGSEATDEFTMAIDLGRQQDIAKIDDAISKSKRIIDSNNAEIATFESAMKITAEAINSGYFATSSEPLVVGGELQFRSLEEAERFLVAAHFNIKSCKERIAFEESAIARLEASKSEYIRQIAP